MNNRTTNQVFSNVFRAGQNLVAVTRWAVLEAGAVVGFVLQTKYGSEPLKFEILGADMSYRAAAPSFDAAVARI